MRLFDVLGPVMIGPSSSHTAGAARIGYTAQKLLGEVPAKADIGLYGSFATTGKGHGTDRALVAGLLKSIRKCTDKVFDVHLMIENPDLFASALRSFPAFSEASP